MWLWLTVCSALLLGSYDIVKKQALKRNGVYWILIGATGLTTLFLCPFLSPLSPSGHLRLIFKAVLVSTSWVSGLIAMKHLPLTTVSTIKASRPMFVVIFSIILFGERLNALQWLGVAIVMAALFLSSRSKRHETDRKTSAKGMVYMIVSVISGAASALYDKHIITGFEPLALQSWTNLYITLLLALILLVRYFTDREHFEPFVWDWKILLIAVLITAADALYFYAVKQPGAMMSVISTVRRSSVLVTFLGGALILKEGHIKDKALDMVLMMAGIALLLYATQ
ncbi:MAG: EamA family transporter [Bacteroidales bacterium]|jgi:transporter family protein|nr:EamA family transporter [Bacteroidales bacterium]